MNGPGEVPGGGAGSARAGPLGHGGGQQTPGTAPGAAGGPSGKRKTQLNLFPSKMMMMMGCLRLSRRTPIDPEFPTYVAPVAPTTRHLQSIPHDPHAMQSGTARRRGRPHRMLRAGVV